MVIQWLGQACFKITSGDLTLVIDPYSKEIGLTPPRFRADIVLVTHSHFDHANAGALAGEPFIITSPGEYDVHGVVIRGIHTFHDAVEGKERGTNTCYVIKMEDITLAHMGDFGEKELREETLEQIGDVDILMIPVGGVYTIDGHTASRAVKQIEPRFVIPMHYKIPGLSIKLDTAETFLKEMGTGGARAEEKLTIKKKDIGEEEKTDVVMLKPA